MNRQAYLARASALRLEALQLEQEDQPRRAAELREVAEVMEKTAGRNVVPRRLLGQLLQIDFDS